MEEMDDNGPTTAYVVVNEFLPLDGDQEIRENLYYTFTVSRAVKYLEGIADELHYIGEIEDADGNGGSFEAPPTPGLELNTYFIEEIEIHD